MVVQVIHLDSKGRRPTVDARPRVGDATHVVDQSSHFGERELLVGLHSSLLGDEPDEAAILVPAVNPDEFDINNNDSQAPQQVISRRPSPPQSHADY